MSLVSRFAQSLMHGSPKLLFLCDFLGSSVVHERTCKLRCRWFSPGRSTYFRRVICTCSDSLDITCYSGICVSVKKSILLQLYKRDNENKNAGRPLTEHQAGWRKSSRITDCADFPKCTHSPPCRHSDNTKNLITLPKVQVTGSKIRTCRLM